jgi:hypothetical protein
MIKRKKTRLAQHTGVHILPAEEGIQWHVYEEQKIHHGCSYQRQLTPCRRSEL